MKPITLAAEEAAACCGGGKAHAHGLTLRAKVFAAWEANPSICRAHANGHDNFWTGALAHLRLIATRAKRRTRPYRQSRTIAYPELCSCEGSIELDSRNL